MAVDFNDWSATAGATNDFTAAGDQWRLPVARIGEIHKGVGAQPLTLTPTGTTSSYAPGLSGTACNT
jgi:hypothetical protein